ncbi:hypothetical protein AWJ20_3342 [Sugiyamaella lignohabitans]|uniref:tRNA-splicing endonuclease subunit Sen15 domain-containing protein n=1 Tax=Sugiyamaella lignohabitans TaxID=796027 RepID=A0A167FU08_9ASCO|nr:uncharacterized protein AWJ20_3342 [Sugiyamaella lignohabitans]ANB15703.1 hypothetical protein AWJ20_3342 [Sugiyamaella lignohabitans]
MSSRNFQRSVTTALDVMAIEDRVAENLVHQHLWTNLKSLNIRAAESNIVICTGVPPAKLHPDDYEISEEYVLPVRTEQNWTVHQWACVFDGIKEATNAEASPRRVVMAMVTEDSTIVYYFVNNGLIRPRKN